MWKSKLKSTLQVLSLLILQATARSTERREGMMCSADESQLMRLFMQLLKAKKVIEIGKINQCMNLCCYEGYQECMQLVYLVSCLKGFMYRVKNTWTSEGLSTIHQSGLVWGLLVGGSEIPVYTAVPYFSP